MPRRDGDEPETGHEPRVADERARGVRSVPSDVCDTEYATNTALKFITAVLNFFLPLTVMYVLYSKIYLEIKRRAQLEIGQKNHTLKRRFSKHVLSVKRSGCDVRGDASPREESLEDSDDSQENRADAVNTLVTSALLCAANIEHSFDSDLPLDADKSHDVLVTRTVKTCDAVSAGRVNTLLPPTPATNHPTAVVTSAPLARAETRDDACEFPETSSTSEHQTRKGETQPEGATLAVDTRTSRAARSDTRTLTQHSLTLQLNTKLKQNASSCSPEHSTGTSPTRLSPKEKKPGSESPSIMRRVQATLQRRREKQRLHQEIKAARQLGVIMGAFTVCFLPYFICFLVVAVCEDCVSFGLVTAVTWIGYCNSTLNPFLYPLCNVAFRRKFRSMLRRSDVSNAATLRVPNLKTTTRRNVRETAALAVPT